MSGFIPATGILPAVLGTRIVLGEAAKRSDVLAERQSQAGADVFGFLLPFTGFALMLYLAIIVGLIATGFALRRRSRQATTVEV